MQFAVRYGDRLVEDYSWECIADVVATYHCGFAEDGRVTGVLVSREGDGDEWVEVDSE